MLFFKTYIYKLSTNAYICIVNSLKLHIVFILILLNATSISGKDYFWKNVDPTFDNLMEHLELWSRFKNDSLHPHENLDQLYNIYQQKKEKQMFARYLYWDIYINTEMPLDSALILTEKILLLSDSVKYPYDHARINMQKATLLLKEARYSEAFHLYSQSLEVFKKIGDFLLVANTSCNIGYIFLFLEEYNNAITFLTQADSIYSKLGLNKERLECQLLLANIYNKTGKEKETYALLTPIIDTLQSIVSPIMQVCFLTAYLPCLEDPDSLQKYSNKAYEAAQPLNIPYYLLLTTVNKGWAFLYTGERDSAYIYANLAKQSTQQSASQVKEGIYNLFASIYAKKEQWDSAYYYQNLYYTYKDSIRGKSVLSDIHRIEIKKEMEKSRLRSAFEKQKAYHRYMFFLIVGTTLVVMLILSIYIIHLLRQRMQVEHKKQLEKDRMYIEHLTKEKELVETKNRELSSNTVLLMKKNKVLQEMLKEMENIPQNNQKTAKELQQKIQSELKEDDSWDSFKLHFDKVHPSFFATLKERCPKLTDNELRLCAYIQIGLSNKQIAQMLIIQVKAVIQARYRLKKKMGLTDDVNINDYLKSILTSQR